MAKIAFHFQRPAPLKNRRHLRDFILHKVAAAGFTVDSVNYIFCDDDQLLAINQQFLSHDTLTDIITFQYNEPGSALLADIYISIDRIRENAGLYETTVEVELHRVIFHGVLHLLGLKDKTRQQKLEMRKSEDAWLGQYF